MQSYAHSVSAKLRSGHDPPPNDILESPPALSELDPAFVFTEADVFGFFSREQSTELNPISTENETESESLPAPRPMLEKEGDAFSIEITGDAADAQLEGDSDDFRPINSDENDEDDACGLESSSTADDEDASVFAVGAMENAASQDGCSQAIIRLDSATMTEDGVDDNAETGTPRQQDSKEMDGTLGKGDRQRGLLLGLAVNTQATVVERVDSPTMLDPAHGHRVDTTTPGAIAIPNLNVHNAVAHSPTSTQGSWTTSVGDMPTGGSSSPLAAGADDTASRDSKSTSSKWLRWFHKLTGSTVRPGSTTAPEIPPPMLAMLTAQRIWATDSLSSMPDSGNFIRPRRIGSVASSRTILPVSHDMDIVSLAPADELFLPSNRHTTRLANFDDPVWSSSPQLHLHQHHQQHQGTQALLKDLPLPWPVSWRQVDTLTSLCAELRIQDLFDAVIRSLIQAAARECVAVIRLKRLQQASNGLNAASTAMISDKKARESAYHALLVTSPQLTQYLGLPAPPRKFVAKWECLAWELARCAQGCAAKLVRATSSTTDDVSSRQPPDGASILARWLLVLHIAVQYWAEIEAKFIEGLRKAIELSNSPLLHYPHEQHTPTPTSDTHMSTSRLVNSPPITNTTLAASETPSTSTPLRSSLSAQLTPLSALPSQPSITQPASAANASVSSLFDVIVSAWQRSCRSPRLTVPSIFFALLTSTRLIVSELLAEDSDQGQNQTCDDYVASATKPTHGALLDASPFVLASEVDLTQKQPENTSIPELPTSGTPAQFVQAAITNGRLYCKNKLLELLPRPTEFGVQDPQFPISANITIRDILGELVVGVPDTSALARARFWRPALPAAPHSKLSSTTSSSVPSVAERPEKKPSTVESMECVEIDLVTFAASIFDLEDVSLRNANPTVSATTAAVAADGSGHAPSPPSGPVEDVNLKRPYSALPTRLDDSTGSAEQPTSSDSQMYSTPVQQVKRIQQEPSRAPMDRMRADPSDMRQGDATERLGQSSQEGTPSLAASKSSDDKILTDLTSSLLGQAELTPALLSAATAALYGGARSRTSPGPSPKLGTISPSNLAEVQTTPPASTSPGLSTRSPLLGTLTVRLDLGPPGPEPLKLGSADEENEAWAGMNASNKSTAQSTTSSITVEVSPPSQQQRIYTSTGVLVKPILLRRQQGASSPLGGSGSGNAKARKKPRNITWAEGNMLERVRFFASSDAAAKANVYAGPPATPPPPDYSGVLIEHIGWLAAADENDSGSALKDVASERRGAFAAAIRKRTLMMQATTKDDGSAATTTIPSPAAAHTVPSPSKDSDKEDKPAIADDTASKIPSSPTSRLVAELSERQRYLVYKLNGGKSSTVEYFLDQPSGGSTLATVTWIKPRQIRSPLQSLSRNAPTPETSAQLVREQSTNASPASMRAELATTSFEGPSIEEVLNQPEPAEVNRKPHVTMMVAGIEIDGDAFDDDLDRFEKESRRAKASGAPSREDILLYLSKLDEGVPTFKFDPESSPSRRSEAKELKHKENAPSGATGLADEPKSESVQVQPTREPAPIQTSAGPKSFLEYARRNQALQQANSCAPAQALPAAAMNTQPNVYSQYPQYPTGAVANGVYPYQHPSESREPLHQPYSPASQAFPYQQHQACSSSTYLGHVWTNESSTSFAVAHSQWGHHHHHHHQQQQQQQQQLPTGQFGGGYHPSVHQPSQASWPQQSAPLHQGAITQAPHQQNGYYPPPQPYAPPQTTQGSYHAYSYPSPRP